MTTPQPIPFTETALPFQSFRDAASVMAPSDMSGALKHTDPLVYILERVARFDNAEQFLREGNYTDRGKGASFPREYRSGAMSIVSATPANEAWQAETEYIEAFAAKMGYKPLPGEEQHPHFMISMRQPSWGDARMSRSMTEVYPLPKSPVITDTGGAPWQLARTETMNLVGSPSISISAVRLPQTSHSTQ